MDKELTRLRPLHEWHSYHLRKGGALFPTFSSLKWFVRTHREALLEARVLIPGTGGRGTLVTSHFGYAVYDIVVLRKKPDSNRWAKEVDINGCNGESRSSRGMRSGEVGSDPSWANQAPSNVKPIRSGSA